LALQAKVKQSQADSPYAINVFVMPGFDMVARVYLKLGEAVFQDHYNIGWWPWELGTWPVVWDSAFGLIDELWAGSQFSHEMYERALLRDQEKSSISRPCTPMPLAVSIDQLTATRKVWNKKKFGLPEKPFLFLYIFDFGSHLERKNPMAAIEAFGKAFGLHAKPGPSNVGLVFKVMNVKEKDAHWIEFQKRCSADKRIHILNETLDREQVLGLISCCDAYISPHRAEGFGRTLAEAMLFGKPVVATNYSGNQFFMEPTVTLPVNYELTPLKAGQYHFVEDADQAVWAEPVLDHMAEQMQVAIQKSRDQVFVETLKVYAQQTFAPARTGDLIKNRLESIWSQINQ
jgi:glycosyltransferase involved in cell wall biosynthesis